MYVCLWTFKHLLHGSHGLGFVNKQVSHSIYNTRTCKHMFLSTYIPTHSYVHIHVHIHAWINIHAKYMHTYKTYTYKSYMEVSRSVFGQEIAKCISKPLLNLQHIVCTYLSLHRCENNNFTPQISETHWRWCPCRRLSY